MSEVLGKVKPGMVLREATKEVNNLALDNNFSVPGDPGFPLNQVGWHILHHYFTSYSFSPPFRRSLNTHDY